jgi:hypothetical protein
MHCVTVSPNLSGGGCDLEPGPSVSVILHLTVDIASIVIWLLMKKKNVNQVSLPSSTKTLSHSYPPSFAILSHLRNLAPSEVIPTNHKYRINMVTGD